MKAQAQRTRLGTFSAKIRADVKSSSAREIKDAIGSLPLIEQPPFTQNGAHEPDRLVSFPLNELRAHGITLQPTPNPSIGLYTLIIPGSLTVLIACHDQQVEVAGWLLSLTLFQNTISRSVVPPGAGVRSGQVDTGRVDDRRTARDQVGDQTSGRRCPVRPV